MVIKPIKFKYFVGIFAHHSTEVWSVKFENGDSLGVTFNHPIYTTSDWKAAGTLSTDDEVLTYTGYTKVKDISRNLGSHLVYNLGVKDLHNFLVGDAGVVVHNGYNFSKYFSSAFTYLSKNSKFISQGTGPYKGPNGVGGHHPFAKSLFQSNPSYDKNTAWWISNQTLGQISGKTDVHTKYISPKQSSLYQNWKNSNPNKQLTLNDVINIELEAMTHAGIPDDVARGWLNKALQELKNTGVNEITDKPWGGLNK